MCDVPKANWLGTMVCGYTPLRSLRDLYVYVCYIEFLVSMPPAGLCMLYVRVK
jgi:hypothetical protein